MTCCSSGSCAIVTRWDRDSGQGHPDLGSVGSPGKTHLGIGGVNAEFPGSGEPLSPSSLRAHTDM